MLLIFFFGLCKLSILFKKKLKKNFEVSLINNNNSNTYKILKLMAIKF